jgi:HSP20 family protein
MPRQDKLGPEELRAEIEDLFSDLWQMPRFAGLRRGFRPNVDSFTTEEPRELTVVIELPGVDPKSLNVVVGDQVLLVAGERPRLSGGARVYQQMEIEYGPFQRQIRLAEDVDPERAGARYEHGVLTITLPIGRALPASQRHAIQVEQV